MGLDLNWYSTVISLLALIVTYCIVEPLKTAISELKLSIDDLKVEMKLNRQAIQSLEQRHARIEEQVKTLFSENDEQNERLKELEHRCKDCREFRN